MKKSYFVSWKLEFNADIIYTPVDVTVYDHDTAKAIVQKIIYEIMLETVESREIKILSIYPL